jgi:hypothetical protein
VLPISTSPPRDIQILIDEQFHQVEELLKPGKRRRAEARAKIRGLLALEGHVSEEAQVSERDVNRVERGIREGKDITNVFPRLGQVGTEFSQEGPTLKVHFTRGGGGAPVEYIAADDPREAAAVREVDLQRKYYISKPDLAQRLELTPPRARWRCGATSGSMRTRTASTSSISTPRSTIATPTTRCEECKRR